MSPAPGSVTEAHERVRHHLLRRAYTAGVAWALAGALAVMVLAWVVAGADGWSPGSAGPLLLDAVALALLVGLAVAVRRAARHWLGARPVAASMEGAAGLPSGAVLGSLELAQGLPAGVSPGLSARAQRSVAERLTAEPSRLAGHLGSRTRARLTRGLQGATVLAVAVAALGGLAPQRSAMAWRGLARPIAALTVPALPPLEVRPGDVEVLRGSTVDVEVEAPGRELVTLSWRFAGQLVEQRVNPVDGGLSAFTLPAVGSPAQYWVEAPDGARTRTFRITPVDPLFVSDLSVALTFPAHTRRVPEEFRGDVPPLRIPVGTRVEIEGRASRPLGSGTLTLADAGFVLELEVEVDRFDAVWYPGASGVYVWEFRDVNGAPAESEPFPLELTLVPDSAPSVDLVMPGVDTVLALSMKQPLAIQVSDDYGLRVLELVAYRVDAFGVRGEPVVNRLDLGGVGAALARPILDVSAWGLLPGDTVRYLARVVDNSPRGQTAQTREYVLRMPGSTELSRDAQRRLEETADRLEALAREAERVNEETRDLDRRAGAREEGQGGTESEPSRAGFEEREQFQRTLEEQSALGDEVDSLRAELEELSRNLDDRGMSDPELREDMEELQELLEQLMSEEAREQLDQLRDSLENISQDQIDEALEALAAQQEEFRERIEESLERFRRAAVEQDFRATTSEAEELAQQESAVADALEEGTDPELRAAQQEALEERAEALDDRMETLEERLERLGEDQARDRVEQARQEARRSRQAMQQAARMTRSGDTRGGAQQAQEAAREMEQAADQLSQAQQNMAQEMAEQIQQAFQQASSDAVALARQQAEVREQMRGATPQEMAELRGDQAAVQQGIRNMAENLSESAGPAGGPDRQIMERLGEALQQAQRTLAAMEEQRNGAPSPRTSSEAVMKALNEAALMAMAAGGQSGQGEGSGDAQQQMTEALESLAQQQGSLMNQTGALVPMQLGQQAQQRQMEQIAREQQQVGDQLDELAQEPDPEGDALGDLEALAREAEALADLLAQGRLDPETLRRQERLFHRLLDAGRTLERDEESTERESEAAGEFERATVLPLTLEALDAFQYTLPDAEALNRLPPAQRQLVIDYFERLNRERPRGPGGGTR